jgi:hypothetical protein
MFTKNITFLPILMFALTDVINGAFLRIEFPRAASMGSAFVALSNDVSSCIYNPAGLPLPKIHEFSIVYSKLFTGLPEIDISQYYVAYAQPIQQRSTCGLCVYQLSEPIYKESVIFLSYGYLLILDEKKRALSLGISVKYLEINYITENLQYFSADDTILAAKNSKNALSLDLGFLYRMKKISAGIAIKNVTQPNIGFSLHEAVPIPIEINCGITFLNLTVFRNNYISPSIEIDICRNKLFYSAGAELDIKDGELSFRGGVNNKNNELSFGFSYYPPLTKKASGRGKVKFSCGVDYAILLPFGRESLQSTAGTHLIGLNLKF